MCTMQCAEGRRATKFEFIWGDWAVPGRAGHECCTLRHSEGVHAKREGIWETHRKWRWERGTGEGGQRGKRESFPVQVDVPHCMTSHPLITPTLREDHGEENTSGEGDSAWHPVPRPHPRCACAPAQTSRMCMYLWFAVCVQVVGALAVREGLIAVEGPDWVHGCRGVGARELLQDRRGQEPGQALVLRAGRAAVHKESSGA